MNVLNEYIKNNTLEIDILKFIIINFIFRWMRKKVINSSQCLNVGCSKFYSSRLSRSNHMKNVLLSGSLLVKVLNVILKCYASFAKKILRLCFNL